MRLPSKVVAVVILSIFVSGAEVQCPGDDSEVGTCNDQSMMVRLELPEPGAVYACQDPNPPAFMWSAPYQADTFVLHVREQFETQDTATQTLLAEDCYDGCTTILDNALPIRLAADTTYVWYVTAKNTSDTCDSQTRTFIIGKQAPCVAVDGAPASDLDSSSSLVPGTDQSSTSTENAPTPGGQSDPTTDPPQDECASDADCGAGAVCELGTGCHGPTQCVSGCHNDTQCLSGEECRQVECIACPCPGHCESAGQSCAVIGGDYCSSDGTCPRGNGSLGTTYDCGPCCKQGPSCGAMGGDYCSPDQNCPYGHSALGTTYDCETCCQKWLTCDQVGGDYCQNSDAKCPVGYEALGGTYDCNVCCKRGESCGGIGGNGCSNTGVCPDGYRSIGVTYDCSPCCKLCSPCSDECPCGNGLACVDGNCMQRCDGYSVMAQCPSADCSNGACESVCSDYCGDYCVCAVDTGLDYHQQTFSCGSCDP